jgi:hypothetical protein
MRKSLKRMLIKVQKMMMMMRESPPMKRMTRTRDMRALRSSVSLEAKERAKGSGPESKEINHSSTSEPQEIAKGPGNTSKDNEDWSSLSATFDHAANKPGAYQGIAKAVEKVHRQRPSSVNRSRVTAQDKEMWAEFLSKTELRHVPPLDTNVREKQTLKA